MAITATQTSGSGPTAAGLPLTELAAQVRGTLLTPADPGYVALATPWNVAATSAPLAVIEVLDTADVCTVVRFARTHGLDVAVQATGHGAVRYDRPTLLVQTGRLSELTIDPTGSARVGAGVVWQQVLDAAAPYGMSGLAGSAPGVGVVGYLTGGGLSPLARTYGYGSDRVTAFDVVTGDGVRRRATPVENPALFWGLRGGKGALGIITAVEFELLPVATVYGGTLFFDGAHAAAVAGAWRTWGETLPEAATTSLAFLRLPAMPAVPPPLAGRVTVAVRFAWVDDAGDGAEVLDALRQSLPTEAEVILGGAGVLPMTALGSIHADPVDPMPTHEASMLLRDLPIDALDTLLAFAGPEAECPQLIVELRLLGGAMAHAPKHPSAMSHRDAAYNLMVIGLAVPPLVNAVSAHADQLLAGLETWGDGALPNFAATADPARIGRNYDKNTLARLGTLVTSYDPDGVLSAARAIRTACLLHA